MRRHFNREHYVIDVSSTSAQQQFFGTNDFRKKMGHESIAAVVSRLFHTEVEDWMPMLNQATKDSEVLIKWRGAVPITCMWKLDAEGRPEEQLWEWLIVNRPRLAHEILKEHAVFLSPSEWSPLKVRLQRGTRPVSIPRPPPPPPPPPGVGVPGAATAAPAAAPATRRPLPPPPPGVGVPGAATAAPAAAPAARRQLPRPPSKAAAPAAAQEPPAGAAGAPLPPQPSYPGVAVLPPPPPGVGVPGAATAAPAAAPAKRRPLPRPLSKAAAPAAAQEPPAGAAQEPPAGAAQEHPPPPQDLIQMVRTLQHWSADIKHRKRESMSFQRLSDPLQKFITDAQSLACDMKKMEKRMVHRMSAQIINAAPPYSFLQPCSERFSHQRQNEKRSWAAPVAAHTRQLAAEIHLRRRAIPPPRSGGRLGGGGRPVGGRGHGRSSPRPCFWAHFLPGRPTTEGLGNKNERPFGSMRRVVLIIAS